mmetsp:Transcript_30008/g.60101  ORF Transcript_30008/g.60101 Transcript_30008/m.60101 type:complete len:131 (+) Transcript_30008:281-673(+)
MENQHGKYLTIGAVQPALRPSHLSPIEAAKHVVHLMKEVASKHDKCKHKKIDLFILPELCPLGYSEDTFEKFLPRDKSVMETLESIDQLLQSSAKVRVRTVWNFVAFLLITKCAESHRIFRYSNYLFHIF